MTTSGSTAPAASAKKRMRGAMTALVTPFDNGDIDWDCLNRLIDRQIGSGMDWLVALGTTGEAATLSKVECEKVLAAVISRAGGRRPVMAGTGTNCTATTVERTKWAASAGADAALVVVPYYNRPTPEGMFRHFAAVAEAVDLPIVLYDVPARTGVKLACDVVVRLREKFPSIVAIKDATGSVDSVSELRSRCDIIVLSGDDSMAWPMMAVGAEGLISVLSNLCPAIVKKMVAGALGGNFDQARQTHRKVYDLAVGIGRFGPNPLPIKSAMAQAGLLCDEYRLPLCPLDPAGQEGVRDVLRRHEMIEPVYA